MATVLRALGVIALSFLVWSAMTIGVFFFFQKLPSMEPQWLADAIKFISIVTYALTSCGQFIGTLWKCSAIMDQGRTDPGITCSGNVIRDCDTEGEGSADEPPHGELPVDFADAFESLKLAIVRQRAVDWSEVDREDVRATLVAILDHWLERKDKP